jgi:flagellar basal-body rod modification protein FlgD
MTSDVTLTQAANNVAKTVNSRSQLAEDFDDFLNLLTTQLQNQDPLSPMDSTEFTNQLVAFAGVEQQINANEKLNALVNFNLTNINTQALSYVGLKANYQSSEAYYDGTNAIDITYAVEGSPVTANVRIADESGETIVILPGSASAGRQDVKWDGLDKNGNPVPEGTYNVQIDAVDAEGLPLNAQVLVSGIVRGVETQDGAPLLLIGERAVPIGNVINVSIPNSEPLTNSNDNTETTEEDTA